MTAPGAQANSGQATATLLVDDGIERESRAVVPRSKPDLRNVPVPRPNPGTVVASIAPSLPAADVPLPKERPVSLILPPKPFDTGLMSAKDRKIYTQAFREMRQRNWQKAISLADTAKYDLPAKYIRWSWLKAYKGGASFHDITSFLIDNPDWPYRGTLMRRAEEALVNPAPADRTLSWFSDRTPLTGMGMLRYGEALLSVGQKDKGQDWIRQAWAEGNFSEGLEKQFLASHKDRLTKADHEARMDRLLWDHRADDAIRMLDRVGSTAKKLAVARIRLMRMKGNVDAAINNIPAEFQNDPGLLYERTRWRRRKGMHEGAQEILLGLNGDASNPELWWTERHIQSRKLLHKGYVSEAYRLASQHGLTTGADFAAAEWLSGWISLRFLHDYKVALDHFTRFYNNVSYPISRARGAYWTGRAYAALKDKRSAQYWYEEATRYATTFYGQVALGELGKYHMPSIPVTPHPDTATRKAFEKNELVLISRHLAELGEGRRSRPFLLALTEQAKTPQQYAYFSELAHTIERPDYAVTVAKRASQLGTELTHISWPTHTPTTEKPPIEKPLVLAITRQESAFAADAVSHAGARGLMQLMPATAKSVSRKLNLSYSTSRLTADPAYNTLLGSTYLGNLIDRFDGSYILAIASYNAGPGRTNQWIREWGDPRLGEIDNIDWIELIPFSETRNYVQRVMENLQVYRQLLGNNERQLVQIAEDLDRGRSLN